MGQAQSVGAEVEAMRLCSNLSASPPVERVLQLAQGFRVSQPVNDALAWESAIHSRRQVQRHQSSAEVRRLGQAFQDGSTIEELASRFRIHATTASSILKRAGIPTRRPQGP